MKNIKTLAIIFSVVLNIAFIGSYLYHRSGIMPMHGGRAQQQLLYEKLNLSRKQLAEFGPSRDRFHAFLRQQGRAIKAKQLELIDLLAREHPARLAIKAKKEEIQTMQRQMQDQVIEHLLKESKIFTPAQRQKFFTLIKGRIEKSNGPRPQWMPHQEGNHAKGQRP